MSQEDLGGAELPPDDLASLGSKRIADPENLKVFGTLKARAFNYLDRHGVRFMSGWAIPEEKAGEIVQELLSIRNEFQKEKEAFLASYDQNVQAWIEKHHQWGEIIRNSTVGPDYVCGRMGFRWQLYKVAPLAQHSDNTAVLEAGLFTVVRSKAALGLHFVLMRCVCAPFHFPMIQTCGLKLSDVPKSLPCWMISHGESSRLVFGA